MKGIHLIIILCITVSIFPSVSAWCILGVGNTCGDRATQPHGFLGDNIFNLDEPQQKNNDVGFFSDTFRPFRESPFEKSAPTSPNDFVNLREGDSRDIVSDTGKVYSIKLLNKKIVLVKDYEAQFFDVDLGNIELRCPSCPLIDGQPVFTAGFDYLVDLELVNTGNTASSGVKLEIIVETPDRVDHINFNNNEIKMGTGQYTLEGLRIPKFGLENDLIKQDFVYQGIGDRDFDMTVTAKLTNSNGVREPRLEQFREARRVCTGSGESLSCRTEYFYFERETCPNGESYDGQESCNLVDPEEENDHTDIFKLSKLSSDLNSKLNLGIIS